MDISFGNFNIFPSKGCNNNNSAASSKYPNLAPLKKDTVSFSGNVKPKKEMSDSEFEELKTAYENQVKSLNIDEKKKSSLLKARLSKENIKVLLSLLGKAELINELRYTNVMRQVASQSHTEEKAVAKGMIVDKIFSDPRVYKNNDFMNTVSELLRETDSIEKAEARCQVFDKYTSYDKLMNKGDEDSIIDFFILLNSTYSKEGADIKCRFIDRIMNDEVYGNNDAFLGNFEQMLFELNDEDSYKGYCMILDEVKKHEELCQNECFMSYLPNVSSYTMWEDCARAKCDLINEFLAKDWLKDDPEFIKMFFKLLQETSYGEIVKLNSSLMDLWVRNKDIIKNGKINEFVTKNIFFVNDGADSESPGFLDKIIRTKAFFEDEKLYEKLNAIFSKHAQKCPEITKFVFDKIFENEKLQNNPAFLECFLDSFFETLFITNMDTPKDMEDAKARFKFINTVINQENLPKHNEFYVTLSRLARNTNNEEDADKQIKALNALFKNGRLFENKAFCDSYSGILFAAREQEDDSIVTYIVENLPKKEEFYKNDEVMSSLSNAISRVKTKDEAKELVALLNNEELPVNQIGILLNKENGVSLKQLNRLNKTMGKEKVASLPSKDVIVAAKFIEIHKKQNINEITQAGKKEFLKELVSCNTGMFEISDELKESFPLIPTNQKEYCALLPSIVRSLGIETNELNNDGIEKFNNGCKTLSDKLKQLTDEQFNQLEITQNYSRTDFIEDVIKTVKGLSKEERNKVYDYFGFEVHRKGKTMQDGYYLTGYPQNLNNGKKLAQIKDPKTKQVVEDLRPYVIKFSKDNHINCPQNKEIEEVLNSIADVLPEMHTMVEKKQHGIQSFDVLKHSLKVMQKISQSSEYENLNESDKKLMHIAALLHDITKHEGAIDHNHAIDSSFDSYFICKKFNLTKDEEIKLYTLINKHEWLKDINISDEAKRERKIKHAAYDFRHENLFDMALVFTHADLKSVYDNDLFHDKKDGKGRTVIDGVQRSFGECADIYGTKIKGYIEELKKSQPLLPVTKLPKADKINEAITVVNPDGSTNIKGVYKDKDGLIVLKFNEIEDFEAIGFEKGSTNKGYTDKTNKDDIFNTGNIKFFVHGLDYENQLAKFDAFSLVDSDALLSVSYAERPESKYRFFRPQGVILDVDTKYVHGGGETDSGSGCGKSIQEFKNHYIFGGYRESDRLYVSNLIKETLGLNDSEYIDFVKRNENKSIGEIEPEEAREKLILAFGKINSRTRNGQRNYNEMYASNPKSPMGVFVYSIDYNEKISNPIDFLNRRNITANETHNFGNSGPLSVYDRTEFLRRYAIERNIPMVVFGD